jgi:Flp pilus assembly pilin Flp
VWAKKDTPIRIIGRRSHKNLFNNRKGTTMLNKLIKNQRGQGMTEYVIILVGIAVVCIAIAVQFGGKIQELFETADTEIDTVDANL